MYLKDNLKKSKKLLDIESDCCSKCFINVQLNCLNLQKNFNAQ